MAVLRQGVFPQRRSLNRSVGWHDELPRFVRRMLLESNVAAALRRATEENPQHTNALHNLAVVYHKQGKVAESVKLQRQAVRLELRSKSQGNALAPEVAGWARKVAYRGFVVVALLLAVIVALLYLA